MIDSGEVAAFTFLQVCRSKASEKLYCIHDCIRSFVTTYNCTYCNVLDNSIHLNNQKYKMLIIWNYMITSHSLYHRLLIKLLTTLKHYLVVVVLR